MFASKVYKSALRTGEFRGSIIVNNPVLIAIFSLKINLKNLEFYDYQPFSHTRRFHYGWMDGCCKLERVERMSSVCHWRQREDCCLLTCNDL
jgi:hypothetical protein